MTGFGVLLAALALRLGVLDLFGAHPPRWGAWSVGSVATGGLAAGLAAVALRGARWPDRGLDRLVLVVGALLFGRALVVSPDPALGVPSAIRFIAAFSVGLIAASLPIAAHRRWIAAVFALSWPGLVSFLIAAAIGRPAPYWLHGRLRFEGLYSSFQEAAQVAASFAVVGFLFFLSRKERWARGLAIVQIAASTTVIGLTQQRTAVMGLWMFAVLWLALRSPRWAVFGAAATVGCAGIFPAVRERYADLVMVVHTQDWSSWLRLGSSRVYFWLTTLFAMSGKPILSWIFGAGFAAQYGMSPVVRDSHSDWLNLWCQFGSVGVAGFVTLWGESARRAWRLAQRGAFEERALGSVVLAWSVMVAGMGLINNATWDRVTPTWLYFCFAGLVWARYNDQGRGGELDASLHADRDRSR